MPENEAPKSPQEAVAKSDPCLIVRFHQLSESHPSYWNPYELSSGDRFSVDMVRLDLNFMNDKGTWLSDHAQTFDCDDYFAWTAKIKPGSWRELWNFVFEESSVSLGIGLFEPSCKLNTHRGFIEFNPNKVCGDKRFWALLEKIAKCCGSARLKRFDLAYDTRRPRSSCRLTKDRRMYKAVISNGITEYLGVKNTPGYVKVYDKAKETGVIVGNMTRIELTCAGDWSAEQLMKHWPQVHGWTADRVDEAPQRSQGWLRVLGLLLADRAERGEEIESYVQMLNWKQKAHVRTYLRTPIIELPLSAAELAIAEAKSWEERFW